MERTGGTRRLEDVVDFEGPIDRPWGNRYLFLRDPSGLRVVLYEGDAKARENLLQRTAAGKRPNGTTPR